MSHILTINSGSSSIKFSAYEMAREEKFLLTGILDRIGAGSGEFRARSAAGESLIEESVELPDHDAALVRLFGWLGDRRFDAVGHRIVHGGRDYTSPRTITPELVADLRRLVPLATEHLPHEIKAIDAVSRVYPALRQVAIFDTAFHRDLPLVARMFPLPRHLFDEGVVRYGFHGISYAYIMQELARVAGEETARRRTIVAHLGNGASMAAVLGGKSVDTTMGFTPTGGLMMGTRTGDLDPGTLLYLLQQNAVPTPEVKETLNRRSGLLGVSGISSDMRELLAIECDETRAAEAIALYCYTAKKYVGALSAGLGGLETLVFTGGIGENAAPIRQRICEGMEFLGIRLDQERNNANAPVISLLGSAVTVRVMKTDEEIMIARYTRDQI
ncbi:MAG: acetate/propionate family kinase [Acidobacteria bacterium]|nr:acetate/propionate family kinase [Acidobacteriota bacterium]